MRSNEERKEVVPDGQQEDYSSYPSSHKGLKELRESGEKVKFYFTGKPCNKCGAVSLRNVSGQCVPCAKEHGKTEKVKARKKKHYQENADRVKNKTKNYRKENRTRCAQYSKEYYQKNKERLSTQMKEYRENNKEQKRENDRKYQEKNKEKLKVYRREYYLNNKDSSSEKSKEYYNKNRESILERNRIYQQENAEKIKNYKRAHRLKNSEKIKEHAREYSRTKYQTDPLWRMKVSMQNIIKRTLSAMRAEKNDRTHNLLGYSPQELMDHLESHFLDGMSWDNHGEWHIDHKVSIMEHLRNGVEDPAVINALDNLYPMWAEDNKRKSDKSLEEWLNESEENREKYSHYLDGCVCDENDLDGVC